MNYFRRNNDDTAADASDGNVQAAAGSGESRGASSTEESNNNNNDATCNSGLEYESHATDGGDDPSSVDKPCGTGADAEEQNHESGSEEEYTDSDDDDDDDSDGYETDSDEEEGSPDKKKGWFSFLRRKKQDEVESDEEDDDDGSGNSSQGSGGEKGDEAGGLDINLRATANDQHPTQPTTTATTEPLEEDILLTQAIQRVQQRIQSKGGNVYNALDESDKRLVDDLRGVEDESVLRKMVCERMEEEFAEKDALAASAPDGALDEDDVITEPSLNTEPSLDTEPSVVTTLGDTNVDEEPLTESSVETVETEESLNQNEQQQQRQHQEREPLGQHHNHEDSESDDDEPTLEEQRSLLSLAAEHDRVDVIQELLGTDPSLQQSLLAGVSHAEGDVSNNSNDEALDGVFVPPPLHAAVAHGSVNAASCLLRMGAVPSLRPVVPPIYLGRHYVPISSGGMEGDRNYKKYHGMSAWELAFGQLVRIDDADDGEIDSQYEEEEPPEKKKGWFGFGSSKKNDEEAPYDDEIIQDSSSNQPRYRRKLPLNISPAKLDGIRHAFTAEALRAIGSDEHERLMQLLDAGMDWNTEVAGKTLVGWAKEMDAKECCQLLKTQIDEEEKEGGDADDSDDGLNRCDDLPVNGTANNTSAQHRNNESDTADIKSNIQDERLVGLSPSDIGTLILENQNLISALTAFRDSLAEETYMYQNILRDVQASGGKGGLSSQSLLELVRSLKDHRQELDVASSNWQSDWEEREDELEFFWQEVLDDAIREEIARSGVLDQIDSSTACTGPIVVSSVEELVLRFHEVENRVTTLRSSIVSLAEENANHQQEIERIGMSGAMSLIKSLREEVSDLERKITQARSGEEVCRKKIEFIQHRLGHQQHHQSNEVLEDAEHQQQQEQQHLDESMDDYQLKAIVEQENSVNSPAPLERARQPRHPESIVGIDSMSRMEVVPREANEPVNDEDDESYTSDEDYVDEGSSCSEGSGDEDSMDDDAGSGGSYMKENDDEDGSLADANDENVYRVTATETYPPAKQRKDQQQETMAMQVEAEFEVLSELEVGESFQKDERRAEVEVESRTVESETITKMPSEAITSGMSTAIVVRYVVWTSIERE